MAKITSLFQAMSIYKYVSPENKSSPQLQLSEEDNSDDIFEYFSDKDEAETYQKNKKKDSKTK